MFPTLNVSISGINESKHPKALTDGVDWTFRSGTKSAFLLQVIADK